MTQKPTVRVVPTLVLLTTIAATLFATAGPAGAVGTVSGPEESAGEDLSLQFTSAGHVLRFDSDGVIAASATHMIRMEFVGANQVSPVAEGGNAGQPDSTAAASLGRVTYQGLWNGVTVAYEATDGAITKSTYYLEDGSMAGSIHLRYNRPVSLDDDGNLLVTFDIGTMVESAPIAWQVIDGHRKPVTAAYSLYSEREVGFALGDCVPGIPVVIDPSLTWNTFLGSSGDDRAYGVAVDSDGNVYISGYSNATWGSPEQAHAGNWDAFAAKLDSGGDLIWNTFLGSSSSDYGTAVAVDSDGNVYVGGRSYDTWGSPQQAHAGDYDAFAAKLDSGGDLIWNTFLGSSGYDEGHAVAVDGDGNVYVGGRSYDTWGSPEQAYAGNCDAFAAKLDSAGDLIWNTFLGSSGYDRAYAVAVDSDGNVYVGGYSDATWGSPEQAHAGNYDAFAAKLDSAGNLIWNTFLGSSSSDYGYAVAVDSDGNVYVGGHSSATWGSPEQAYAGNWDAFAARLSSGGDLIWNTFLGSSSSDYGYAVAVDSDGNVYVSGYSSTTWGSPEQAHAGDYDAFAAKLDSGGDLIWNTFLGSSGYDEGHAVAVDGDGNVYVGGFSNATWGSPEQAHAGDYDAFAAKLDSGTTLLLDLKTGWNMVSVPVEASDMSVGSVFPDVAAVYTWDPVLKSYSAPPTIEVGAGYWVAVTEPKTITVTGTPLDTLDIDLTTGWNMVGSVCGDPVNKDTLVDDPDDSVLIGSIYSWNPTGKSYNTADFITEGLGYWVATTCNCCLTMTAPA